MLTVIKLGGSLYHSPQLADCLHSIAEFARDRPVVLIAGGGPFANAVRLAQQDHHLSDKTAHQMAINAMRQFALLLIDLLPDAQIFCEVFKPPPSSGLRVWLPDDSQMMVANLPQNWQVTADSLSLWLAQQLDADELILIKSCVIDSPNINELTDLGVLDPHFVKQHQRKPLTTSIVQYVDSREFLRPRKLLQ